MTTISELAPAHDSELCERIAVLEQQLARSQRLAALGELLSTTTHEFNNVLMTILNYASQGLRHKDEATRDKALDKIFTAAKRASKITSTAGNGPLPSGWARYAGSCGALPMFTMLV